MQISVQSIWNENITPFHLLQDIGDVKFISEKSVASSSECDHLHFLNLIYKGFWYYFDRDEYNIGNIELITNCVLDPKDISLEVSPQRFDGNIKIRNIFEVKNSGYAIHFEIFKMDGDAPFPRQIRVVVTAMGTIQFGFLSFKA